MSPTSLPHSSPAASGVDAEGIGAFLDAVDQTQGVELHSLMILRHGAVVASGWWSPYSPEGLQLLYSLSKSFTATALGVAVDNGLVSLDDPVLSFFPELDAEVTDPRSRKTQLKHLAAMSSGHRFDTWDQATAADPANPVRGFFSLPPSDDPGTVFAYNQSCTYTLATVIQRVAKCTVTEYLRSTVLEAIGTSEVAWTQQPVGQEQGFSGLHATTETIARLGQLYLANGCWDDRAVVSAAWVANASEVHSITDGVGDAAVADKPDWRLGYGFQFWRSTHGYRADGAFGQYSLVLPDLDAVIAITGQTTDTQALLDLVWAHLIPAFRADSSPAGTADAALEDRLAGLSLDPCSGAAEPSGEKAWAGTTFAPGEIGPGLSIDQVAVSRMPTGWITSIFQEGERLDVPISSCWQSAIADGNDLPMRASGGWAESGNLRVEVIFVETPHRLVLECSLADHSFAAEWVAAPRRPTPLMQLRAPSLRG